MKYPGIRGTKAAMAQNLKDSIKRRGQTKNIMNYSKETADVKSLVKPGTLDFYFSTILSFVCLYLILRKYVYSSSQYSKAQEIT